MATKDPLVCATCGSDDIQVAMWVYVNEDKINDEFGSPNQADTQWCWKCDASGQDGHVFTKLRSEAKPVDARTWAHIWEIRRLTVPDLVQETPTDRSHSS